MARSYSDESYSAKQTLSMRETGALNGTAAAAATVVRSTFMQPVTVTDWNIEYIAGGTNATRSVILGKSAAGTGAVTAIGTIAIGTQAIDTVKDGSVTATDFNSGDDIVVQSAAGTSTTVENVSAKVQYREDFVVSDT